MTKPCPYCCESNWKPIEEYTDDNQFRHTFYRCETQRYFEDGEPAGLCSNIEECINEIRVL